MCFMLRDVIDFFLKKIDNYLWEKLSRKSQLLTSSEDSNCVEDGTDQNTANPQR